MTRHNFDRHNMIQAHKGSGLDRHFGACAQYEQNMGIDTRFLFVEINEIDLLNLNT